MNKNLIIIGLLVVTIISGCIGQSEVREEIRKNLTKRKPFSTPLEGTFCRDCVLSVYISNMMGFTALQEKDFITHEVDGEKVPLEKDVFPIKRGDMAKIIEYTLDRPCEGYHNFTLETTVKKTLRVYCP